MQDSMWRVPGASAVRVLIWQSRDDNVRQTTGSEGAWMSVCTNLNGREEELGSRCKLGSQHSKAHKWQVKRQQVEDL